jgi:hypothetical protein
VTVELPQSDWLFLPQSDGWSTAFSKENHTQYPEQNPPSLRIAQSSDLIWQLFSYEQKGFSLCHVLVFWKFQDSSFGLFS